MSVNTCVYIYFGIFLFIIYVFLIDEVVHTFNPSRRISVILIPVWSTSNVYRIARDSISKKTK